MEKLSQFLEVLKVAIDEFRAQRSKELRVRDVRELVVPVAVRHGLLPSGYVYTRGEQNPVIEVIFSLSAVGALDNLSYRSLEQVVKAWEYIEGRSR